MDNPTALAMLRTDLGRAGPLPENVDAYLDATLDRAAAAIARDGLTLDLDDPADLLFLTSYAAWLYRKRDVGAGLSRMLRDEINDRKVAKCTGGAS